MLTVATAISRAVALLRALVEGRARHALLASLLALASLLVSATTAATPHPAATTVSNTREAPSTECHVYVIALRVPHVRANARRLGAPGARSVASTPDRVAPPVAGGRHHGALQGAGDFSAGVSSAITFGLSDKLIGATGLGKYGSKCSGAFAVGRYTGMAVAVVGGSVAGLGRAAVVEGAEAATAAEGAGALRPLVYGPSAGGRLAVTAESLGGETLSGLAKPMELGWEAFSKQTLDAAAASGRPVIFDLTHVQGVPGVLNGTGQFANTVTGAELRYIQGNWATFQGNVTFISGGVPVGVPW